MGRSDSAGASADLIARVTAGMANDLVTTAVLATASCRDCAGDESTDVPRSHHANEPDDAPGARRIHLGA